MLFVFACLLSASFARSHEVNNGTFTEVYVKQSGDDSNNGTAIGQEKKSLRDAYFLLVNDKSNKIFVVHDATPLTAEAMLLTKTQGITIEGVNEKGDGNTEVAIDCNATVPSSNSSTALFACYYTVEFKYLAFQFSTIEHYWDILIYSRTDSLGISNCQFVRIGATSQGGITSNVDGNSPVAQSLVEANGGKVIMNSVKCTDETSFVTFSNALFIFDGAEEVTLNEVEINKVNVLYGSSISVSDSADAIGKFSIEGLNIQEVNTERSGTAGLNINLGSVGATLSIGRTRKCTFKSCTTRNGLVGAMLIYMSQTKSYLKLPAANNLDIDGTNTVNSTSRSIFIRAPDIEEFCEQEDSFEFANDYDESAAGWIMVAKDEDSDPVDVYEKYIKVRQEKQKEEVQKKKTGTIVAIVAPIVVVVVAVVVVVVIIVVRKRKSKSG
ncbi:uncharacterized protein MONOS_8956 [Monocercomonoides exilis]|uniref:uncharacterized protein n=1 Tax=Monocercomonoides exilis TaxID=2049356 RepID=UPI003559BF28|nr:hypothetical protein MONOS_8956 [Monocercomonoides exilis]|eukprot:MONOS_8956.1-p1 / transcript=MONOS_8956.1 / gene=MONOS_8956 / organism=Monocercomonoides_exilis_PA203 / gene_product=unspecified product / transcript_product=unspecified product / location=Mono_scaffold00353:23760-25076(-) / protein_length=439 / sequence_SO=supercontig / SO=protein_coding / is_pseudo=false